VRWFGGWLAKTGLDQKTPQRSPLPARRLSQFGYTVADHRGTAHRATGRSCSFPGLSSTMTHDQARAYQSNLDLARSRYTRPNNLDLICADFAQRMEMSEP
jgi:hypothetical protein